MAAGKGSLLNLLGKTNASGALVIIPQAVSGTPGPASTLANKECAVDASNRLVVTFG